MNLEYYIIPFLMNFKFNTGYIYLDTIFYSFLFIFIFLVDTRKLKDKCENYIDYYNNYNVNKVSMIFDENNPYDRPKAVIDYMIKNCKINGLQLSGYKTWDKNDNINFIDMYIISQKNKIIINNDLYAYMKCKEQEVRYTDSTVYKNIYELFIVSKTLSVKNINNWINKRVIEHQNYLKHKTHNNQLLLSISFDKKVKISSSEWSSSVTFENSWFPNKDNIMKKIDFFLNNKEWYYKKGIPYNLGILLHGEPGCGKTRFIKQLMNYTKRHAIDIKLNDDFDFNILKKIITQESISENYIIPQDKRIIVFEDIDAMTKILKDRDAKKEDKDELKELIKKTDAKVNDNNNNNNLSYFLNIIDGLNECSGRIIIMTTNKVDYLDKAIIRPGRIDINLEFKKLSDVDIKEMIKHFWDIDVEVNKDLNNKLTSAQVMSIFRETDNFDDIKYMFIK